MPSNPRRMSLHDQSHNSYNAIATFSEQDYDISPSELHNLGTIFVKHKSHTMFGVTLIHRHDCLPPGVVMVHSEMQHGADICRIEEYGARPQYPCAYHLTSQDNFEPFEYSETPSHPPDKAFLSEVASFLQGKNLERTLGITQLSKFKTPLIETILQDGHGTIARQSQTELDACSADIVITEWGFSEEATQIHVRALKACTITDAGSHKRE